MHVYTLCRIIDAPGIGEQLTNRIHALHRDTNTITMPTYKYDVFLCHHIRAWRRVCILLSHALLIVYILLYYTAILHLYISCIISVKAV